MNSVLIVRVRSRALHLLADPAEFSGVIKPFDVVGLYRRVMLDGVEAHLMPVGVVRVARIQPRPVR